MYHIFKIFMQHVLTVLNTGCRYIVRDKCVTVPLGELLFTFFLFNQMNASLSMCAQVTFEMILLIKIWIILLHSTPQYKYRERSKGWI